MECQYIFTSYLHLISLRFRVTEIKICLLIYKVIILGWYSSYTTFIMSKLLFTTNLDITLATFFIGVIYKHKKTYSNVK